MALYLPLIDGMNPSTEKSEPLAVDVSFTPAGVHVVLVDGRKVSAPLQWFPRLLHASAEQREHWELIGDGVGIHWTELDEDIEVENLLGR